MATRGRPNKAAPKKAAAPKAAAAKKATPLQKAKGLAGAAVGVGLSLLGGGSSKKGHGVGGKHKSAKALLRKAYERRAKRQIRVGDLGHARRTLRKKATVV